MVDNVMVNIGAVFMIVGGAALVSVVLGLAIYAAALVWVSASNKLRRRAKRIARCKDCKHLVAVNVKGKGIPTCRMSGMEVAPAEFCSRGEKGRRC